MKFTKMHGLGNDYIYINCFSETVNDPRNLAIQISDRHFGIGGDGIVLILPSVNATARMRMFNADGSEAEMCGNAIRCVGKFLYEHQITTAEKVLIETKAGIKELQLIINGSKVDSVRVDMGEPILRSDLIPVSGTNRQIISESITVNGHEYQYTAVSMGNPHCIIFVPELRDEIVLQDGPVIESNSLFPQKINVEFAKVLHKNLIEMRVWERGSGETLACGTGSCATLVAAVLNHLTEPKATVKLLGGDLMIEWDETSNHVYMTGPAVEVFQGEYFE